MASKVINKNKFIKYRSSFNSKAALVRRLHIIIYEHQLTLKMKPSWKS